LSCSTIEGVWTFEEALAAIEKRTRRVGPELADPAPAQGRVLDQEVVAGADLPPFDTTAMDGWALTAEDLAAGRNAFEIVGVLAAGDHTAGRLEPGRALKVMTGAAPGAATVVPGDATVEGNRAHQLRRPHP
jgi:molybdopterin molybdotransferase